MSAHKKSGLALLSGRSGFTLVELLVVISIIAILSVIGITVFSGVQKGARDARRKADIDAIANAMEVNKTAAGYSVPSAGQFAGGSIPHDPLTPDVVTFVSGCGNDMPAGSRGANDPSCWYCFNGSGSPSWCKYSRDNYANNFATAATFLICANLETGNPAYYCKGSTQ